MLKGIPPVIFPELIATLIAMGRGDDRRIISGHEPSFREFELVERFSFYERARAAYAVLATSEMGIHANIILKKGLVKSAGPAR